MTDLNIDITDDAPAANEYQRGAENPSDPRTIKTGKTLLDQLAAVVAEEITLPVTWALRNRPGWVVEFEASIITGDKIRDLNRTSRYKLNKPATQENINFVKYAAGILSETSTGIRKGSEYLTDDDGDKVTLRSLEFLDVMGEKNTFDAVRKFVGTDGELGLISAAIQKEAGFAEGEEESDPLD